MTMTRLRMYVGVQYNLAQAMVNHIDLFLKE